MLHCLPGHKSHITCHQFDERMLASASLSGHVLTWDLRQGRARPVHLLDHDGSAVPVFQYDGSRLASGTADGRTLLWDLRTGSKITEWSGSQDDRISALAMDDYRLVSAGNNNSIYVSSFLPNDDEDEDMGVGTSGGSDAIGCGMMDVDSGSRSARGNYNHPNTCSSSMRSDSPPEPDEGSGGLSRDRREGQEAGSSSSPSSGGLTMRAGPLRGTSGLLSPDGSRRGSM
jgi:WD40 repeat protein